MIDEYVGKKMEQTEPYGEVEVIQMVKKYDWKITLKKVGIQAVVVVIAGLASIYGNNPYFLALVPVFTALENYIKHK